VLKPGPAKKVCVYVSEDQQYHGNALYAAILDYLFHRGVAGATTWAKVQGNYDEWQILEWKFKIPAGFQPTQNFCHIHQLKGQDGPNIGSPVITITPRANSDGSNKRVQIIHSVSEVAGS